MKKKFLALGLSTLLSLSLISCSSGIKTTTNPESYSDLDKEYAQFNTKALTVSYLKKKLDKWKVDNNGKKMLRELEYAKFKHIDILKQVISNESNSYAYYQGLTSFIQVTSKEGNDSAFKAFVDNLSPLPSTVTTSDASNITNTSFTANWNAVSNASGYMLIVDNGTPIDVGNVTSKNITGLTAGSSHSYIVKSVNSGGLGISSNVVNVTLVSSAPVASVASDITQTSFTANWATVSGATSYKLFIDDVEEYSGANLSFSKTGLTVGSSHSYYVQASNASGVSANSNSINVTLNPAITSAPVASDATSITDTSFTANWATVSGATSYKLIVDNGTAIDVGNVNTKSVTGLTAGTAHTYIVQAVNSGGTSTNSNTINLTLNPATPVTPTASAATNITNTGFTANWATVSGATSYKLKVDNGSFTDIGNVTHYDITGLTPASTHTYTVQASNITGTSSNSSPDISVTLKTDAPVATSATNITTTSFTANWATVTGASAYHLFVNGTNMYNGTSTSVNIDGLTAGTACTYYVTATNAGGTSVNSNIINVSTVPSAPVATAATSITSTGFTANWGSVTGAASYKLYVDGTNVYTGTATTYPVTGMSSGTTHNYYVTATNAGGTSANSNTVSPITISVPPVATSATNITTTSFTANWGTVAGTSAYHLFVDGTNMYNGTSTSVNIDGLTAGTACTYYVTATNAGGTSSSSNIINISTVPSAPVATAATSITSTGFTANWGSVTGAASYKLYVDGTNVYTGTATTYPVTGMSSGTTHNYYVTATNAGGTSANSNTVSPITISVPPVATSATSITTTSFTANWGTVAGTSAYHLFVDGTNMYNGTSTSVNINGLTAGTSHTYYVTATNAGGTSSSSNIINVGVLPSAPVASSATSITQTSFTANWATVSGATSYKLYVFDGTNTNSYTTSSNTYSVTSLTYNKAYSYYVQAINSNGASSSSNTINLTTLDTGIISGATATASSYNAAGYEPQKVLDNDINTFWNYGTFPDSNSWLLITLSSTKTIQKVRLLPHATPAGTVTYKVQGSNDGSSFTDIFPSVSGTNITVTWSESILSTPTQYKYIKIVPLTWNASWVAIKEVQIYGW